MLKADKAKLIPHLDYLEREIQFLPKYQEEVDWKVYQSIREKRLEIERWVESLINATLDLSKMVLTLKGKEVPETSRELLFKMASLMFDKEADAEAFSEMAKIRNTLAHRYLDIRWQDIKRFIKIAQELYPVFIPYLKKEMF